LKVLFPTETNFWDVVPFAKETGSALRSQRTETFREDLQRLFTSEEEDEDREDASDPNMNLSTKTILQYYTNIIRDKRMYTGCKKIAVKKTTKVFRPSDQNRTTSHRIYIRVLMHLSVMFHSQSSYGVQNNLLW
jgi:hypothetical protein